MSGYTKLFNSIIGSTIWREDSPTKVIWITLLALADRDGIVESSVPGLANYAGVSIAETEAALQKFQAPDAYSRSPENDGRRIESADGGWRLLNYAKYRLRMSQEDIKERNRVRQQRHREQQRCHAKSVTKRDKRDMSHESRQSRKQKVESNKQEIHTSDESDASALSIEKATDEVWEYYIPSGGHNPNLLTFTEHRRKVAKARFLECLKLTSSREKAVNRMKAAIEAVHRNPWLMGENPQKKKYCSFEKNIFRSAEQMQQRWEEYEHMENAAR